KLDGDARGGAALSAKVVTGKPIYFAGMGEKVDALQPFYPDRIASRILGMGDMLTLIEKATEAATETPEVRPGTDLTMDDLLREMRNLRKMGPLEEVLKMIPGLGKQLQNVKVEDKAFKRMEAIILSMTPKERAMPRIINGARRKRIARGSGTTVEEVNALLRQHAQMRDMMKALKRQRRGGKLPFPFPGR
ncbi:MAG: signal recognition particle protein, partial [Deinococcus sp.]|nr:signal recognition particle protein [Deinococcus sp.]